MSESLPVELQSITGIGKERLLQLRYRRTLGLSMSDDEPSRYPSGRIVPVLETLNAMQMFARRALGPDKAHDERRYR